MNAGKGVLRLTPAQAWLTKCASKCDKQPGLGSASAMPTTFGELDWELSVKYNVVRGRHPKRERERGRRKRHSRCVGSPDQSFEGKS